MTEKQRTEEQQKEFYNSVKDLSTEDISAQLDDLKHKAHHVVGILNWLNEKINMETDKASIIAIQHEVLSKILMSRK
jgi:hypothetical protein